MLAQAAAPLVPAWLELGVMGLTIGGLITALGVLWRQLHKDRDDYETKMEKLIERQEKQQTDMADGHRKERIEWTVEAQKERADMAEAHRVERQRLETESAKREQTFHSIHKEFVAMVMKLKGDE